ncbi:MAG TPA: hypothetical protein VEI06_00095, partial [Gemmatimonadaceae bacterium]|nr:hypothetical protein [Gemmatimonadaceae bacterium]
MLLLQAVAPATHPLDGTWAEYAWLLPLIPLVGFVLNGALSLLSAYHAGPRDPSGGHEHDDAAAHAHGSSDQAADDHGTGRHRFAPLVSIIGPLVLIVAFALAAMIFFDMRASGMTAPFIRSYGSWIPAGDLQINWALQLDQLSMVMVLVITG